ncbi:MAG: hypothetical protein WD059_00855 [Balneolaceae bacterium]
MNFKLSSDSWRIACITGILFWVCTSCAAQTDDSQPVILEEYSRIESAARGEISGIVKSRKHENVFWVHGDSGNQPKIFLIYKNGLIASDDNANGIELDDIDNIDWEDITVDDSGNLIVADIGNNCFCRENLSFLIFPEPDIDEEMLFEYQRIRIEYPEKLKFLGLAGTNSPDAEAVFYADGAIYLLTKEKNGIDTQLYKLETRDESTVNTLIPVSSFTFDDKVTASDFSEDGQSLAVLTSSSVWFFTDFTGDNFFTGTSQKFLFRANQVESVAFSGEQSLIIAEEEGQLYEVLLSDFK